MREEQSAFEAAFHEAHTSIPWETLAAQDPSDEAWLCEQAEAFLKALFEEATLEDCILRLMQAREDVVLRTVQLAEHRSAQLPAPTLEALLAYKDAMRISDGNWKITVRTFQLGSYASISHIKTLRNKQNHSLGIRDTAGGNGAMVDLLAYLREILEKEQPDNSKPIIVKIAFDAAAMTTGKRIEQEISTFELLYDMKTLSGTGF